MSKKKDDESSDSTRYEVEKVLSHRIRNGKLEYKIKWRGWDDSWNQWLPKDDLFCEGLIKEHHRRKPLSDEEISVRNCRQFLILLGWPTFLPS